jgi:hypothetical protein
MTSAGSMHVARQAAAREATDARARVERRKTGT